MFTAFAAERHSWCHLDIETVRVILLTISMPGPGRLNTIAKFSDRAMQWFNHALALLTTHLVPSSNDHLNGEGCSFPNMPFSILPILPSMSERSVRQCSLSMLSAHTLLS